MGGGSREGSLVFGQRPLFYQNRSDASSLQTVRTREGIPLVLVNIGILFILNTDKLSPISQINLFTFGISCSVIWNKRITNIANIQDVRRSSSGS